MCLPTVHHDSVVNRSRQTSLRKEVKSKMRHEYIVSLYVSIEAESEEEAREIAFGLEIVPKRHEDQNKIFYNSQNTEVEEAPF